MATACRVFNMAIGPTAFPLQRESFVELQSVLEMNDGR